MFDKIIKQKVDPKRIAKTDFISEIKRCKFDPSYFAKNYIYIKTKQKGAAKFKLWDFQETTLKQFQANRMNIVLKSRQLGLTELMAMYVLWFALFNKDKNVVIVSKNRKTASDVVKRIKYAYKKLPPWLKIAKLVSDNVYTVEFDNDSIIFADATTDNAGRGTAASLFIVDEAAFIPNFDELWATIFPTIDGGGSCIINSTPNGSVGMFYELYTGAPDNGFNSIFLDWNCHPDRDNEWFEKTKKSMSPKKFAQEYLGSFLLSGDTVIDGADIARHEENICEPIYKLGSEKELWTWREYNPSHRYVIGCLPDGEKVLTDSGLKNIENITQYDKLINEKGEYVNIINKQIYKMQNEDIYSIKIDNTFRKTKFTKEHPILVSQNTKLKRLYNSISKKEGKRYWDFDFKYIKAENLSIGDWIKVPNIYKKELDFNINDKWFFNGNKNARIDFKINSPLDNKNFWWFIGLWIGDGWIGKYKDSYSITICFNKKEDYYLQKCITLIEKLFNRSSSVTEKDSTYDVTFNNKELYYFLLENFGQYSYAKKIPEWVKFISKTYKLELIKGYFDSDGCWVKINKKNKIYSKISFVSINLELLESVQDILFSIGIISSLNLLRKEGVHIIRNKKCNTKKCYNLDLANFDSLKLIDLFNDSEDIKLNKFQISNFNNINKRIISSCHFDENENFIFFKIKNIEKSKFTGNVYNFECETHTFMCHHITTHNCDVSRGDGEDFSAFTVFDIIEKDIVCEYKGKIKPDRYAELLYRIGSDYGDAIIAVENNGYGLATLLKLIDLKYPHIYGEERGSKDPVWQYVDWDNDDVVAGFTTRLETRILAIDKLEESIRLDIVKIYSKRMISEFRNFIYENGKPKARKNSNDDLVMSLAITLYVTSRVYSDFEDEIVMKKTLLEAMKVMSTKLSYKVIGEKGFNSNFSILENESLDPYTTMFKDQRIDFKCFIDEKSRKTEKVENKGIEFLGVLR